MIKYLIAFFLVVNIGGQTLFAQCDDCYETPFLGVYSNGISEKKARLLDFDNSEGSYVTGIIGNTAAEKAGLQPFDYIYGIDEYRTDRGRSLTSLLRKYDPGDEVMVHFYRKGDKYAEKVRLGTRSDAEYNKRSKSEDPFLGIEQRSKSWDDDAFGVKVNVVSNSTAKSIGLENGDVISHINGYPVLDWTDVGAAIDMMVVGNDMVVTYTRDGKKRSANGIIRSYADTKYNSSRTTRTTTTTTWSSKDSNKNKSKHKNKSYSYHYDSDDDHPTSTRVDVWTSDGDRDVRSRDVEDMAVEIGAISGSMPEGVEISNSNNLSLEGLSIKPNESTGHFDIKFELSSKGNTVIDIYNSAGRNIYNYDLGSFSGSFEDAADLAQNGAGTYYMQVKQDGKSTSKELVLSER